LDIDVRDVGPAPLLAALGRELGIIQAINETVEWDEKQCFIDPGTHTLAMIIDPLLGEILDSNLDDKSWNRLLLSSLPEHFTPEKLKTLTFVADYAFVTAKNLFLAEKLGLKFISRLPATYDLAYALTLKAFSEDNWFNLGRLAEGKDKAYYRLTEYLKQLDGKSYRFLVVHSSTLDKRKLKNWMTGSRVSKKSWKKRLLLLKPSSSPANLTPKQPLIASLTKTKASCLR
jgi:hypothetical protein